MKKHHKKENVMNKENEKYIRKAKKCHNLINCIF